MNEAPVLNPARIEKARLASDMSRADLAFAVRRVTDGRLKPTEQTVRRWAQGKHLPSADAVSAIATATGNDIDFFYEQDGDDADEEESQLLRDLEQLPADLRLRVERALRRARSTA
jgi:transcriptional regulator with XRE-family HTH domain